MDDLLEEEVTTATKDEPTLEEQPLVEEKIITQEEQLQCEECGFVFTGEVELNFHKDTQHKNESFITDPCEPQIEVNHKTNAQRYPVCPFCHLESKTLDKLKIHIENIHTNRNPKRDDQDKIQIRTTELCAKCDSCEFQGNKSEMKNHSELKHGIKYPCIECGNVFYDQIVLNNHIQSVHNVASEPFPCELCGLVLANFIYCKSM